MSPRKKNESDKQRNMGRIAFWCSLYSASFKEQYVNRLDAATDMTCISYWCRHFDFPVRHCAVNTGCTLPVLVKLLGLIKVHCCTQVLLESCYKQWILWPFQTQCISQCTCWCTPAVHSAVRFAWRSKRKKKKAVVRCKQLKMMGCWGRRVVSERAFTFVSLWHFWENKYQTNSQTVSVFFRRLVN